MGNTYTQIHIQIIFAVQNRKALIKPNFESKLYSYISGIIQNYNHKVLQINGVEDHVHILIGYRPNQALSSLVQKVKQDSSKWLKANKFVPDFFKWQEGFGAFSYSKDEITKVIQYIQNQEDHHKTLSFQDEYRKLLEKFDVQYDEKYILTDPE